jgi:AcrR family transcriptional regulator
VIANSQRERLMAAAIRVVAEQGYAGTTIADMIRQAGISRTTFYELFDDKEACFLAAYDGAADVLVQRINAAFETEESWPAGIQAALEAMLAAFAADPALARLGVIGVGAAGPAAQRRYRAVFNRLTPLFDEGRDFAPGGRELPANTSRMAIGGVAGLISEQVLAGRAAELRELLADALLAALSPYLGRQAAANYVQIGTNK